MAVVPRKNALSMCGVGVGCVLLACRALAFDSEAGLDACSKRSEGTELRIVSYNILDETFCDNLPEKPWVRGENRSNSVGRVISTLAPDVVCVQEARTVWPSLFPTMLPDYRTLDFGDVFSRILYNPKSVMFVEGGIEYYPDSWANIRNLIWALMVHRESGRKFIVTNTHWDISDDIRVKKNAGQMAGWVKHLAVRYKVPVFSTGDFNADVKMPSFRKYLSETGAADAGETAVRRLNAEYCSCVESFHSGVGPEKGLPIDHILYDPASVTALCYALVIDEVTRRASDHLPAVAEPESHLR